MLQSRGYRSNSIRRESHKSSFQNVITSNFLIRSFSYVYVLLMFMLLSFSVAVSEFFQELSGYFQRDLQWKGTPKGVSIMTTTDCLLTMCTCLYTFPQCLSEFFQELMGYFQRDLQWKGTENREHHFSHARNVYVTNNIKTHSYKTPTPTRSIPL